MSNDDLDLLLCQLRDSRAGTRAEAAKALAQRPSPLAKKDLMRCLSDVSDPVRYWATMALASLRDESTQPVLTNQLEDPTASVRMVAARAFFDLPYKRAAQPLMKALGDANENVADWASRALAKLGASVVPQLITAMGGRSWRRRKMAATTVRRIGPGSLELLLKALRRPDKHLQYWILQVVGDLKVRSASSQVIPFLGCQDTDLLLASIRAAGELGDRRAVEPLIPLLGHAEENVRLAAVHALSRFGDYSVKSLADLLSSNKRVLRMSASMTIAAAGDSTLSTVLERLTSESRELRYWAIRALERFENPAIVPLLVNLLEDDEFDVQVAAATALANFELTAEVVRELVHKLSVEHWRVRRALAEALERQTHVPVRVLVDALASENEDVRFWVTKLLPAFRSEETVRALIERFEDPSWPIRKNAAEGLARLGDAATPVMVEELARPGLDPNRRYWLTRSLVGNTDGSLLPFLVDLLTDRDPAIRRNAHDALVRFGERAIPQLLDLLKKTESRGVRETVASCIVEVRPPDVDTLIRMYRFRDPEVNYWMSWILGHLGPQAMPSLARLVVTGDERERSDALSALAYLPGRETFRLCLECLDDEFISVRRQAVRILGSFRVPEAGPKLVPRLQDADDEYLASLIQALGRIGGEAALGALLGYLEHDRWEVRKEAVRAVGEAGDPRALGALTALLREDSRDLLAEVLRSLGKLGSPEAADAVVRYVNDADEEVQVQAIRAIGQIGSRRHGAKILPLLGSERWEVVRETLEALGKLGGPVGIDALRPILSGDDLVLKGVAQRSLKHLLGADKWRELTQVTIRRSVTDPAARHLEEARRLVAEKKPDAALNEIRQSLRHEKRWDAYSLEGTLHLEARRLEKAARAFRRALRLQPGEAHSTSRLAVCHLLEGHPEKAEPLLEKLLRDPRTPGEIVTFARRTLGKLTERG